MFCWDLHRAILVISCIILLFGTTNLFLVLVRLRLIVEIFNRIAALMITTVQFVLHENLNWENITFLSITSSTFLTIIYCMAVLLQYLFSVSFSYAEHITGLCKDCAEIFQFYISSYS